MWQVTSLEPTLVDIAVRPAYAGGPSHILTAFRSARSRVSVKKLLNILKRLDHVYPYHQSIAFYLKLSDYPKTDQDLAARETKLFNFYLDYGMQDPVFDQEFKIYYPKSLA